jgi:hypothetical protein
VNTYLLSSAQHRVKVEDNATRWFGLPVQSVPIEAQITNVCWLLPTSELAILSAKPIMATEFMMVLLMLS